MHLSLSRRHAKVGVSINTRTEKHGQQSVSAADVPFAEVTLDALTLNTLLDDDDAHDSFFFKDGDLWRPRFKEINHYALSTSFTARVVLFIGNRNRRLELAGKMDRIRLTPTDGGLTELAFVLKGTPTSKTVAELYDLLDTDVDFEVEDAERVIEGGAEQPSLPLNDASMNEDEDEPADNSPEDLGFGAGEEAEEGESSISRKIRGSEAKKARKARKARARD